ncbi:hypothetical protein [Pantoea sp. 1.19]|uniref:hypothetical protein n=1 Tax=Pantoea sp. 1.19 TaxID=1925589 RepID=UPI000948DA7D|nr:hypothetical protein [Pantoea sp. 1.19]
MKFISLKIGVRKDRYVYFDAHVTLMLFLVLLMLMIVLAMAKESVMPKYFFSDQITIFNIMKFAYDFQPGSSYTSTAYFYKLLGFEQSSVVFAMLSSLLIMTTYVFILIKVKGGELNLLDLGVFLFFVFLSVVNLTWQSKDFIVFLVMLPSLLMFASPRIGLAVWTLGALLFAYYFRTYWFLFVLEFYGLLIASRFISSAKTLVVLCLLSMLVLAVAVQVALGVDVDAFRTSVNEIRLDREGDGSNTLITPWVPGGNPLLGWINISITWFTFFFPFPLIVMLSPYYLIISLFIIMMFTRIWTILHRVLRSRGAYPLLRIFSLMVIAFTVIQSMFEPDYGSYLRHLGPLYPFMFYVYLSFGKVNKEN